MGWASGDEVFDPVAQALVKQGASDEMKIAVLEPLIDALRDKGWDTEHESAGMFREDAAVMEAFRRAGVPCGRNPEGDYRTTCALAIAHCGPCRTEAGQEFEPEEM